jgi:hypothetical protein
LSTALPAAPGDILAVSTGTGWEQTAIKLSSWLRGTPAPVNHVIGITHQDIKGRWIGLQGQPGGVGLVDCTPFLAMTQTRTNHAQPRLDDHGQLTALLASAAATIGVGYDWAGIAADAAIDLHMTSLAADISKLYAWPASHGQLPGDVVCASLWAALYDLPQVNWAHPDLGDERVCQPAAWWYWSDQAQWAGKTAPHAS